MFTCQKGFSLIELMMVIVIVSIASTIIITQYSKSRDSKALFLGAKQVANDVRMAQNYTFSSLGSGGANPSGGYGIRFSTITNPDSYIIFGDKGAPPNHLYNAGEAFQTIKLPEGITITSLDIGANNYNDIDVVFTPPYGEVYLDGLDKAAWGSFVDLEVEISNSAGTEIVTISNSRRIN